MANVPGYCKECDCNCHNDCPECTICVNGVCQEDPDCICRTPVYESHGVYRVYYDTVSTRSDTKRCSDDSVLIPGSSSTSRQSPGTVESYGLKIETQTVESFSVCGSSGPLTYAAYVTIYQRQTPTGPWVVWHEDVATTGQLPQSQTYIDSRVVSAENFDVQFATLPFFGNFQFEEVSPARCTD